MNNWTLRDRLAQAWAYIRHPLNMWGALIAFKYCERNRLEIHFPTAECTCNCECGYPCDRHRSRL